jgi:hypothetical protein
MKIVTYSLCASSPPKRTHYHKELCYSVKSLRVFNKSVTVCVFLYGEHPNSFMGELKDHGVRIHLMGPYLNAIRRIRSQAFRTLAHYPVLHKWLNFSKLEPLAPSQILQIDCDTLFFGDVGLLFERYSERQFYAREEPASRASHYGYDSSYLDEDILFTLARREGASEVGPYNMGVCMLNHGLWTEIAARRHTFLSYIFRFTAWMSRQPETREKLWPGVLELFAKDLEEEPGVSELLFPSSNLWIVEQVALWLTLGQIPGLTHGYLSRGHATQGGEQAGDTSNAIVYHYFGIDKTAFLSGIIKDLGISSRRRTVVS